MLFLLVITGSLSGCAIFEGNELPEFGSLPAPATSAKKPSAGYAFTSAVDMGGKKPQQENVRTKLEAEFVEILRESGYFASVEQGGGKDINISVELVETGNPAALAAAVVTGLSLYTIPSWATVRAGGHLPRHHRRRPDARVQTERLGHPGAVAADDGGVSVQTVRRNGRHAQEHFITT
ncbi:MAG: hypothetical protein MZV65_19340 [Chromatiales bacterium]|nr:hypothetical protein [Chromatiales bacterium]